jgi:hypothetical protein
MPVGTDGPLGVYIPASGADFTALGLPTPDFLWLCQESSGNLLPTIGDSSVQLAPSGSPLYQQSVSGWTRKFVGTTEGVSTQGFRTVSSLLNLSAGESYAMLGLASVAIASAGGNVMLAHTWQNMINMNTTALTSFHDSVSIAGNIAGNHNNLALVRPILWFRNAAANFSGALSDLAQGAGTHAEQACTGMEKGIGGWSGGNPTSTRFCWLAIYKGSNAERDWGGFVRTLGWTIPVAKDGPSRVYVPRGPSDFTVLGLPTPDFLWLCQDSSGSLAPVIGNPLAALAPNATPLYSQAVTGWTRKFVGTTDGTAGHRFSTTHSSLDLSAGESYAVIAFMAMASAGSNSILLAQSGTDKVRFLGGGDTRLNGNFNGVSVAIAGAYQDAAFVRPLIWFRDCAADVSGCKTDQAEIVGTHDESAKTGLDRGIGNTASSQAATVYCCWYAVYKGVNAERDWYAFLRSLGWDMENIVNVTLANATATATATAAIAAATSATLADATLVATGTADVAAVASPSLANAALAATGTVDAVAALSSTLENASAAGVAGDPVAAAIDQTLRDDTLLSTSTVDISGGLDSTLQSVSILAAATNAVVGQLAVTLANASVVATATLPDVGIAVISPADATLVATATLAIVAALDVLLDDVILSTPEESTPSQAGGGVLSWSDDLQGSYQY